MAAESVAGALPPRHAELLLGSYTMLLASARLVMTARVLRAARQQARRQARVDTDLTEITERIETLSGLRDTWALRCAPTEPQFWITGYTRLLERVDDLERQLSTALDEQPDPAVRRAILESDLPLLRETASDYRQMLRAHQLRSLRTASATSG